VELGPATSTSEVVITGATAEAARGAVVVVATGCAHCVGDVVVGLVAVEGLEGVSGDVRRPSVGGGPTPS
jgi:hypothetical protein